jgi:hypothetical protein
MSDHLFIVLGIPFLIWLMVAAALGLFTVATG